ncbi:MAG TPA: pilus assembly protein N-terminal domain-containing protein [Xanthobacteraceae bacterium]|nr:pilus assembly protein N-terminal domain-containing protein [Xanthobacteraceae bacterium]
MTAFCVRGQWAQSAAQGALLWLLAAVMFAAAAAPAAADEPITIHLDQAKVLKLPDRAATVVIGDPLIADMSIQPGGLAVLTGKGYGETNVVVLDKSSAVLMEKTIEVKAPAEPLIMVFRGPTRQTYSCTPECSPRATLGDTGKEDFDKESQLPTDYFAKTLGQGVTRNTQALAAGGAH